MADSIWKAEGGTKARYPYGVVSAREKDPIKARQICIRIIKEEHSTWSGKGCFVEHLSLRYCPPQSDPQGHINWRKNVKFFFYRRN